MNPLHTGSIIVLLLVPFAVLFGDIQFDGPSRFGLASGAFGILAVAWLVASVLALRTARDSGASPAQVWILVVLGFLSVALGGAAAA